MTAPAQVTLLTAPACSLCDHAKTVLKRVAADYPLEVDELDLDTEPGRQMAQEAGMMFAPGVFLDGRPFGFGRLSEKKLRRALASSARQQAS